MNAVSSFASAGRHRVAGTQLLTVTADLNALEEQSPYRILTAADGQTVTLAEDSSRPGWDAR